MSAKPIVPAVDPHTETFFSGAGFVRAWSVATNGRDRAFPVPVRSSGPARTMYAIQQPLRYGSRFVRSPRPDFYLSPGWSGELQTSTVAEILGALTRIRTRALVWRVRFDHETLAAALRSLGLSHERVETRAIVLDEGYEAAFARYSATTRNHVRKAQRRGVTVRDTTLPADVVAYYALYQQRARTRRWTYPYSIDLTLELLNCSGRTRFLVAEHEGRVVGGALFARDGATVYLFHSAFDQESSRVYPIAAVYDAAIQWSVQIGATYFNLGTSGNDAALERSKAAWGGRTELNWKFEWNSPLWLRASSLKDAARRALHVDRPRRKVRTQEHAVDRRARPGGAESRPRPPLD